MKTHEREIMIYYNPDSGADKRTVAHALSISQHIKAFAFGKTPSTNTSWQMILEALEKHPKELLNKSHPYYRDHIKGREFDDKGWLDILRNNPQVLKAPIAVRGDTAILCQRPTDIYQLMK